MVGGSAIRGSRVGAGPMGEAERGDSAPRLYVSYFCSNRHETRPAFAADAVVPETWDCPRCGLPANLDSENPPPPPKIQPYKTHLAYGAAAGLDVICFATQNGLGRPIW